MHALSSIILSVVSTVACMGLCLHLPGSGVWVMQLPLLWDQGQVDQVQALHRTERQCVILFGPRTKWWTTIHPKLLFCVVSKCVKQLYDIHKSAMDVSLGNQPCEVSSSTICMKCQCFTPQVLEKRAACFIQVVISFCLI